MNRLMIFATILWSCLTISLLISDSGLGFSENETLALNTTIIDKIMRSKITVNTSQLKESKVMDYFYGDSEINDNDRQLDISVFEPEEVKLLFETAKSKGDLMEREFNMSRRWYVTPGFIEKLGKYYIDKSMDFMRQSVYGTRYRLKDTKYLRKYLTNDIGYKLAILYGSLMQLRIKMDNIYSSLYKFNKDIKFLWHIVLYERCLSVTVDANYMVHGMFELMRHHQIESGVDIDYMPIEANSRDRFMTRPP